MKTGLIVCGALGREVKDIVQAHGWDVRVIGVSPEDHMYPLRIAPDVEKRIRALTPECKRLLVVFGDCGSQGTLDNVLQKHGVERLPSPNCYEMYAGKLYYDLLDEVRGTFFLTDFLVRTFHRAVVRGLGLDRFPQLKREFFHNCKRVAYLAQKDEPELRREARSIADYLELPLAIHVTGYGALEKRLEDWMRGESARRTQFNRNARSGLSL
ncbi:MAG: DUF1638 domain-containing protein [Chloroflexi bacterium]|nr:DUF1638 domain-containing protein [Chloroflexota bacterium]